MKKELTIMPSDLRMQETGTHTISTFFSTLRRRVLTLTPVQRLAALFSDLSGEAVSPLLTLRIVHASVAVGCLLMVGTSSGVALLLTSPCLQFLRDAH